MKRVMSISKTVGRVLIGLALVSIAGMNLLMGYIMFAPDDLPKPFYLAYQAASPYPAAPGGGGGEDVVEAAPAPVRHPTPEVVVQVEPGLGFMVDTGTRIVNLADPGGRRYLKINVVLEVPPPALATEQGTEESGGGEGQSDPLTAFNDEINKRMPVIDDVLTTVLSSKGFESIYTVEGKETLREEILEAINKRLPDLYVMTVYFTEFVVQ